MSDITLQMTLTVKYDPNGTSQEWLERQLRYLAHQAAGEGQMSGESDATVDEWNVKVERIA